MRIDCSICDRAYNPHSRRPIVLGCGHSLCLQCVQTLPEKTCPMDRISFSNYTTNQVILDLITKPAVKPAREYERLYKICFVGESSVGKTTLLSSFIGGAPANPDITIGLDMKFKQERSKDGKLYKFQLWDTGGQEKFRSITRAHYKNAHIILVVYSLCDSRSLNEVERYWLQEVRQHSPSSKVLLVGNKLDLEREVSEMHLKRICQQYNCEEVKVSCRLGLNIGPIWQRICQYLIEQMPEMDVSSLEHSMKLSMRSSVRPNSKTCC